MGTVPDREPVLVRGDGAPAGWDELVSAGSGAEALVIGENHGHPLGLATAARLWADVLSRSDRAALSMEFFERDEQSRVDEYLAGLTDEKQFRTRTGRSEGNYPPGHRDMVEAAKAAKRPVIASNTPRPLVRAANRGGAERLRGLGPSLQGMMRIPDELPTGRYRTDFESIMSGAGAAHGPQPASEEERKESLENGFLAQSVWDWTMAESISRALDAGSMPVCHVVGRFHSDFRGGLVQALEKLRPGTRIVTVSFVADWSDALREEDRGRGDFVIYVGPMPVKEQAPPAKTAGAKAS